MGGEGPVEIRMKGPQCYRTLSTEPFEVSMATTGKPGERLDLGIPKPCQGGFGPNLLEIGCSEYHSVSLRADRSVPLLIILIED